MTTADKVSAREDIGRGRVEALSDGVFAIVVTLLVLEIKVPELAAHDSFAELVAALLALAPKFISWVISFMTVCVIWLNHHRLFALMSRVDNGLFWWNANLLLWTSFIPFPTALMGEYPGNTLAVVFYGLVMSLMGLGFVLLRWHMHRHLDLLRDHVDLALFRRGTMFSVLVGPVAYLVGAGSAFIHEALAFACYAAIAIYFVFPQATRVGR